MTLYTSSRDISIYGGAPLAVKSDLTVSIGYYKLGQFKGDAEKYIGKLTNADIGIVLVDK